MVTHENADLVAYHRLESRTSEIIHFYSVLAESHISLDPDRKPEAKRADVMPEPTRVILTVIKEISKKTREEPLRIVANNGTPKQSFCWKWAIFSCPHRGSRKTQVVLNGGVV